MTELLVWLDALDEVVILRVAYTVAALLGIPCALWCLWASWRSWLAVRRLQVNGGLLRSARGYRRRDVYYVGVLTLISWAGLTALVTNLPLRSVLGLMVLLIIAVWTALISIADYHDRRAVVDEALP